MNALDIVHCIMEKNAEDKKPSECPSGTTWDSKKEKCVPCPGGKIRSQGLGRGLGIGGGKGPMGIPIGNKIASALDSLLLLDRDSGSDVFANALSQTVEKYAFQFGPRLIGAGIGAGIGALTAGEGNRMAGAMGGAAMGGLMGPSAKKWATNAMAPRAAKAGVTAVTKAPVISKAPSVNKAQTIAQNVASGKVKVPEWQPSSSPTAKPPKNYSKRMFGQELTVRPNQFKANPDILPGPLPTFTPLAYGVNEARKGARAVKRVVGTVAETGKDIGRRVGGQYARARKQVVKHVKEIPNVGETVLGQGIPGLM